MFLNPRQSHQLLLSNAVVLLMIALSFPPARTLAQTPPPGPPSITSIMVRSTARCLVTIDDQHKVLLDPGTSQTFFLPPGEYNVVAKDVESRQVLWRKIVTLESGRVKIVSIDLPNENPPYSGPVFNAKNNLDWTRKDNLKDVPWEAARTYCSSLTLGERTDWRLPTIDELESLCQEHFNDPEYRSSAIEPSSLFLWTSSTTNDGKVISLFLGPDCGRMTRSPSALRRAVCVRHQTPQ